MKICSFTKKAGLLSQHLKLLLFSMFFLAIGSLQAQSIIGVVTDESNAPMMGVNIMVKGSSNGTQTDFDGKFNINANSGDILVFSYLGFLTKEVTLGIESNIKVILQEDVSKLDEVVVVGYGTQKKSDLTGAIGQVKTEELNKVAVVNPTDALQGRVAGVTVVKSSGAPGAGVDIKIRGTGTFGSNSPLYIIDGVQATSYFLDPNDIESIEVLKDVSSAAIYGTRAANGVVLISTKKGKKGEPKVNIHSYVGFNSTRKRMKVLNASEYLEVHRAMYENAGETLPNYINNPPNVDTDWIGAVFRDATMYNHSVNISGATDLINYSISGNLANEEGVVIGSEFEKKTINAKVGINKGKFKVNTSLLYSEAYTENYKLSLKETYHISPLIPIYDDTKESGFGYRDGFIPDHRNPIGEDHFENNWSKNRYVLGNINISYEIITGLEAKLNYGFTNSGTNSYNFNPRHKIRATGSDESRDWGYVSEYDSEFRRIQQEYILNYKTAIGDHNLNLLAGYSRIREPFKENFASVTGYKLVDGEKVAATLLDPSFATLDAFDEGTKNATGSNYEARLASTFGRINYDYMGKYLFQASIRRDGSSRFGKNKRYGTYPSFAIGWKISQEDFMQDQNIFDFLKLRASWGQAGNDNAAGYYVAPTISSGSEYYNGGYVFGDTQNSTQGSIARALENNDLQWETNTSFNIGLDFAMLESALSGSINYYNSKTTDLIIPWVLPDSAGIPVNPNVNFGEFTNSGIELELGFKNQIGEDFNYSINATFGTTANEVTKLTNEDQEILGDGLKFGSEHFPNLTIIGHEVGAYYLYQADGIFQNQDEITAHAIQPDAAPGDIRFKDINGDGVLDESDRAYSGTGIPKYEYSLNLGAEYKGFDFTLFFQGVGDNKIYNGNSFELLGMDGPRNFTTDALNAWTPSNTNTDIPRAVYSDPNNNNRASTRFLEDGGYLRLKTIQLGYSIPTGISSKLGIENLRFYVSGQNLMTLTNYSGLDPEVGGSALSFGVDRTLYPKYKSVIMGVQLKF
ncbi:MAG: TonB-dependent receptor [Flavobacteriaceae bacterium]|nr:TonB-dependent receptor [Flavobacteriaceae bacterium]